MQQPFALNTADGKRLYGFLHPAPTLSKDSPVIVLVHGLTGHMNEYMFIRLAQLLVPAGYHVVRFSQYDDAPDARTFHESTIHDHVADTKTVVQPIPRFIDNALALDEIPEYDAFEPSPNDF